MRCDTWQVHICLDELELKVAYTHLAALSVIGAEVAERLDTARDGKARRGRMDAHRAGGAGPPASASGFDYSQISDFVAEALDVRSTPGAVKASSRAASTTAAAMEHTTIKVTVEGGEGIWLHLLDDADGIGLPMFELALDKFELRLDGTFDATDAAPQLRATLSLTMHALNFNPHNSRWEPVLETTSVRVEASHEDGALDAKVLAHDPIELNVSHALLLEIIKGAHTRISPPVDSRHAFR